MNTVFTLIIAWVFAFFEDVWFNRLLTYQLSGEAERKVASGEPAITAFNRRRGRMSWVALAAGLTMIVLSFPKQFTISINGLLFITGMIICIGYIVHKVYVYQKVSQNFIKH